MRRAVLLLCFGTLLLGGSTASALKLPSAKRCPVFPKSSPWNQRVDQLPVAPSSDEIVRSIGANGSVHADFGSGLWEGAPIGIPITVVGKRQPKKRVSFEYAGESDRGPYPIPRNVKIEGGRFAGGPRYPLNTSTSTAGTRSGAAHQNFHVRTNSWRSTSIHGPDALARTCSTAALGWASG